MVKPLLYGLRLELDKQAFPAIFNGWIPLRIQCEWRPLHIALVITIDVRHYRFEPRESGQCKHFAQSMELNYAFDADIPRGPPPALVGHSSGVKIGVNWHIVSKPFRSRKQCIEFHEFHGPIICKAIFLC